MGTGSWLRHLPVDTPRRSLVTPGSARSVEPRRVCDDERGLRLLEGQEALDGIGGSSGKYEVQGSNDMTLSRKICFGPISVQNHPPQKKSCEEGMYVVRTYIMHNDRVPAVRSGIARVKRIPEQVAGS
jgi:hypothetical protein